MKTRMQAERERQKKTRAAIAREARMSAGTVGQIESGYIGRPYPVQLAKIATALGWDGEPEALLEDIERP